MNLPLWQFGKRCARDGGSGQGYGVLAAAADFDAPLQEILRRVAADVAWLPGDGDGYAPCLGCWPLGGGDWLLFRFLDAGLDDYHRPHTLRIEAALCRAWSWDQVRPLLATAAWPAAVDAEATEIALSPTTPPEIPEPAGPILLGDRRFLSSSLFPANASSIMASPPPPRPERAERRVAAPDRPPVAVPSRLEETPSARKAGVNMSLVLIAVAAVAAISGYFLLRLNRMEADIADGKAAIGKLEAVLRGKDGEIAALRADLAVLDAENRNLREMSYGKLLSMELRSRHAAVVEKMGLLEKALDRQIEELESDLHQADESALERPAENGIAAGETGGVADTP